MGVIDVNCELFQKLSKIAWSVLDMLEDRNIFKK